MNSRRHFLQKLALPGFCAACLPTVLRAASPASASTFQRGVALGLFHEDPLWSYAGLLREIKDLSASHVSLVPAYYQEHAGSTEIYRHPRFSVPDETITRTVSEAHSLGLSVMLFPIVRLATPRKDSEWRGTLTPDNRAAWWDNYKRLVLHLARLCADHRVAQFSVGSEFSTLDGERDLPHVQKLVASVRSVFRGHLTYSGNWDHYDKVALYDLCDSAGLCAYFPLASRLQSPPISLETMVSAWQKKQAELVAFSTRIRKPLLFTEVGYLSQRGASAWPWEESAQKPIDLEDQRRAYEAFATVWQNEPALQGAYFWNYYGFGGRVSRGYTMRHKPAAQEMERYFLRKKEQ
jgi:hypothetical protein